MLDLDFVQHRLAQVPTFLPRYSTNQAPAFIATRPSISLQAPVALFFVVAAVARKVSYGNLSDYSNDDLALADRLHMSLYLYQLVRVLYIRGKVDLTIRPPLYSGYLRAAKSLPSHVLPASQTCLALRLNLCILCLHPPLFRPTTLLQRQVEDRRTKLDRQVTLQREEMIV